MYEMCIHLFASGMIVFSDMCKYILGMNVLRVPDGIINFYQSDLGFSQQWKYGL